MNEFEERQIQLLEQMVKSLNDINIKSDKTIILLKTALDKMGA